MINIEDFDPKLLKLDKKSSMDISTYYIGYVTKKSECNINSVNSLYLFVDEIGGFIEEENVTKYLNIALTDNNNEVLKKYENIKFDSDDNLALNTVLKFHILTIIIRNIFEKDGTYYPQLF